MTRVFTPINCFLYPLTPLFGVITQLSRCANLEGYCKWYNYVQNLKMSAEITDTQFLTLMDKQSRESQPLLILNLVRVCENNRH